VTGTSAAGSTGAADGTAARAAEAVLAVMARQRACRSFTGTPVGDDTILRLLRAATFAPSAENRQPWEFVVVRDAAARRALADLVRRAWEGGARDAERRRLAPDLFADVDHGMTQGFATAPAWIVACADHERGLPATAASSLFPAVQNILLGATALGLGCALTTIATAFTPELQALLGLPGHVVPMAAIPLGEPARRLGPPQREPAEQHTHRERYGTPW
jgi:nitroreductase